MTPDLQTATHRLLQRLQLPTEMVTEVWFHLPADGPAALNITKLLTEQEVDQLSTWFVVEGLEAAPQGEMTFNLVPREPGPPPPFPAFDPVEQDLRQKRIEELYRQDGREDPAHPMHGLLTGLVAQQQDAAPAPAAGEAPPAA